MTRYILIRLAATLPVVFCVMLFTFALLYAAPGDPAAILAGDQATPDRVAAIRAELGLDRPFAAQFLQWARAIATGDFGQSILTAEPVGQMILDRVGPTLSLMLVTLTIAIAIALPLGICAAAVAGSWLDRLIMLGVVLAFSVPVFVVGYMLAGSLGLRAGWFPVQGYVAPGTSVTGWLHHLILPAVTLSTTFIALLARMTRATMIEVLQQDYIRTARAKGVARRHVLLRHALRNALLPVVTVAGLGMTVLISGAVVTETIFSIPGLGRLIVDSILRRDYPVIQAVILVLSLTYIAINLAIDLTCQLIDPRGST